MKHFKLECKSVNAVHVGFAVFDPTGANCGHLIVRTQDARDFVAHNWNGDVHWNAMIPALNQNERKEITP